LRSRSREGFRGIEKLRCGRAADLAIVTSDLNHARRFDEAATQHREAIELDPDDALLVEELATFKRGPERSGRPRRARESAKATRPT
jgi:hypothetical protein